MIEINKSQNKAFLSSGTIIQLAKFVAIGGLNTALDFLIFNFLASLSGVESGAGLFLINICSFTLALVHSYVWNRGWTFSEADGFAKTLWRAAVLVVLALFGMAAAVLGAKLAMPAWGFVLSVAVFLLVEVLLWRGYGVRLQPEQKTVREFVKFFAVSLVGLGINSGVLLASAYLLIPYGSIVGGDGVLRNIAKAAATGVSLIWNFIGYKLFVFKK